MADQKMVKVDLRHSIGLKGGKLYGPGEGVEVPEELANALGLPASGEEPEGSEASEEEDTSLTASEAAEAADLESEDTFLRIDDFDEAKVDELKAEASRLNLRVDRAEGEGAPVKSDYQRVLSEYDEGLAARLEEEDEGGEE